ncbi:MAG: hypothetical protein HY538_02200 [Deltaproteobacteria bacterium]|nr:hypothetical protein [Deltaproteobacteria bacterium]
MKKGFREIFLAKPPPAKKGEINYSLIDRFTLVHFMIGFGYDLLGLSLGLVVLLALVWELLENPLKAHLPFMFPHGTADTLQNSVGDTLAVILGWIISRYVI